jgi:DNA-binding IclR family transcriptional regulator
MTAGEFNPGVIGISAPIFNRRGISLAASGSRLTKAILIAGDWIGLRLRHQRGETGD